MKARDRAAVLALLPVTRIVAFRIDHDPRLGVAVERDSLRRAENFFAARA
jgi:hypothetical protein